MLFLVHSVLIIFFSLAILFDSLLCLFYFARTFMTFLCASRVPVHISVLFLFVRSPVVIIVRLLIRSCVHPFIHTFAGSLGRSFDSSIRSFVRWFGHLFRFHIHTLWTHSFVFVVLYCVRLFGIFNRYLYATDLIGSQCMQNSKQHQHQHQHHRHFQY